MTTRHQAREIALQILYRYEVGAPNATSAEATPFVAAELARELEQHFNHFAISEDVRSFVARLVSGSLLDRQALDSMLEKHTAHWKISRMSLVDRSLLRMACYEMLHITETPKPVVIDEAIELAKQFGTADSPAFVNGVLDSIQKGLAALHSA
jgi:N utilization substance protein B